MREKFDHYAQTMVEKLRNYEDQCRTYHENSINGPYQRSFFVFFSSLNFLLIEFRTMLELVEHTSSLMAKLELDEQLQQAEKVLNEIKQQFDATLNKTLNQADEEKEKNFEQLRPTFGHPARKNDLQNLDSREKKRQDEFQQTITQYRLNIIVKDHIDRGIHEKLNLSRFTFVLCI